MSGNPMHSWKLGLVCMHSASRCGAFSRRTGLPCKSPAMTNGRCRMHGGNATGRPRVHGRYGQKEVKIRRALTDALRELQTLIKRGGG